VKTGVQEVYKFLKELDSGFRRNDRKTFFQTFYESIIVDSQKLAKKTKKINLINSNIVVV